MPWRRFGILLLLISLLGASCIYWHKNRLEVSLQAARSALAQGDYDAARASVNEVLELEPGRPDLRILSSQIALGIYDWDMALAEANQALKLDALYAPAYYQRALVYVSINQTGAELRDDALADFERYLNLAPQGEHAAEAERFAADLRAAREALGS